MKIYKFHLKFHWSLFIRVQLTTFQHWFRQWLDTSKVTSHYLNHWWLFFWFIYVSLGLNELRNWRYICVSYNFSTMRYCKQYKLIFVERSITKEAQGQNELWHLYDEWLNYLQSKKVQRNSNCIRNTYYAMDYKSGASHLVSQTMYRFDSK